MADREERKQIAVLRRLSNTKNGNPRYAVHFTDGTHANTAAGYSVAYILPNAENQGVDLIVSFDAGGRITNVRPAPA